MTVSPTFVRRHLGPYQILQLVGAGGMGEIYRARDARLNRDVAIKVLPQSYMNEPELLKRLAREARAVGSLNHPNIVAVYDVGSENGVEYVVMELLEGETLGDKLTSGPLSPRKAVEYATQIARGLAAAHEKNIVHRDLKPQNIFITRDGRVKILDFGLAREARPDELLARLSSRLTTPGMVMGTAAYMSPEQARGQTVDHRSDIFSFGVTLYEMLSGKLPFERETAFETMSAIVNGEPPDLQEMVPNLPPVLYRLVGHCLEKSPDARFQSARDLVFNLENCADIVWPSKTDQPAALVRPGRGRVAAMAGVIAILVLAVAALALWNLRAPRAVEPSFQRLTFRPALIPSARFTADGDTVVYSASTQGEPLRVHLLRTDLPESQALTVPSGELAGISRTGEMAVLLNARTFDWTTGRILARVPVLGGTPREVVDGVLRADWAPDGRLAVWRRTEKGGQLEFPLGNVLYSSPRFVITLRVSPNGEHVAINVLKDGQDSDIMVFGLDGSRRTLTTLDVHARGMAWTPDGKELWYSTPGDTDQLWSIYGVTLDGRIRSVMRAPGWPWLYDIARDGTALIGLTVFQSGVMVPTDGGGKERDLSWLDSSVLADISWDGKSILFTEFKEGVQYKPTVFMRSTDLSPAVRLGEGVAVAFSPRKDKVLAIRPGAKRHELVLLPTGAGKMETLPNNLDCLWGGFLPDGRIVFTAQTAAGPRMFLQEGDSRPPRPLTPPGMAIGHIGPTGGGAIKPISPDGRSLLVFDRERRAWIVPLDAAGGSPRLAAGVLPEELPAGWSADGRHIYVYQAIEMPAKVYDVDLATGERRLLREVPVPAEGAFRIVPILLMPDGQSFAYGYYCQVSTLYTASGLR
jgi:eukaryotic-like serine/threonine-protein kinase